MLASIKRIMDQVKPECSEGTRNQNARYVKRIYMELYPDDTSFDLHKFQSDDINRILEIILPNTPCVQKNLATACTALMPDPLFTSIINQSNEVYQSRINAHIPSQRDIDNKITVDELECVNNRLKSEFDGIYQHTKTVYTQQDLQIIRNYLLFQLISGRHMPPRRSKDWTEFRLLNVDPLTNNYILGRQFVFTTYKTAKHHGTQYVDIPDFIYNLLCIWRRVNPSEWLIPSNTGKKFAQSNFCLLINKIIGSENCKGKSTTQLRKSYLQTKFGVLTELENTMQQMGSSQNVIMSYISNV